MTAMDGANPGQQMPVHKKNNKQMVSREDLMKAIQKMQLPDHKDYSQQVYPPTQVWGSNG